MTGATERLAIDERWLLAQRIARSRTLRRATHLQKIVLFISESALLHPDRVIREQDIAQGVLGRNDDFDPAYDTIVRVQMRHLRTKLADYYADEGTSETLLLKLPLGSYVPCFEASPTQIAVSQPVVAQAAHFAPDESQTSPEPASLPQSEVSDIPASEAIHWFRKSWLIVVVVSVLIVLAGVLYLWRHAARSEDQSAAQQLLPYLSTSGNRVAVVLPDTSLLLIQKLLGLEIPLESYTQASYPMNLSLQATDPGVRTALHLLGLVRTTTLDEASVGSELLKVLDNTRLQGELRYARDLKVRDLGEGSYILIGNQRSNPWVSLFADRSNFRYVGLPAGQRYVFRNMHPMPGEQTVYTPKESDHESANFVDILLTPNLTNSGYVLLIVGSDVPANEAAVRFIMGSKLPSALTAALRHDHLQQIEVFLAGHHLYGESNDRLSVVAFRTTSNN